MEDLLRQNSSFEPDMPVIRWTRCTIIIAFLLYRYLFKRWTELDKLSIVGDSHTTSLNENKYGMNCSQKHSENGITCVKYGRARVLLLTSSFYRAFVSKRVLTTQEDAFIKVHNTSPWKETPPPLPCTSTSSVFSKTSPYQQGSAASGDHPTE